MPVHGTSFSQGNVSVCDMCHAWTDALKGVRSSIVSVVMYLEAYIEREHSSELEGFITINIGLCKYAHNSSKN